MEEAALGLLQHMPQPQRSRFENELDSILLELSSDVENVQFRLYDLRRLFDHTFYGGNR